ncbi:hypothetical protein D3C87_1943000 [compost metagenome]
MHDAMGDGPDRTADQLSSQPLTNVRKGIVIRMLFIEGQWLIVAAVFADHRVWPRDAVDLCAPQWCASQRAAGGVEQGELDARRPRIKDQNHFTVLRVVHGGVTR